MNVTLALISLLLAAASGLPGLVVARRGAAGERIATAMMALGGALGALACARTFVAGETSFDAAWLLPWGSFSLRLDGVAAVFLLPVFVVPALGSVYGLGYWPQRAHPENGAKLRLAYGVLTASMAMVVLAQDGVLFLLAWEIMAIAAFVLITTEDGDSSARQAGWVYLVAAHLGTLCLLPMFGLLAHRSGSFAIVAIPDGAGGAISTAVFVLALIGFGLKAGLFPLHVWLPGAHASAPSHVSAVLSGVMLKMGLYGVVRIGGLFPAPAPWWGGALLAIGAVTGVIGIAYAIGQHDLKRLLAYSSIENVGIIAMGTGLALLGRAVSRPEWVALGLGGALLHVWNHSLFKPLLFFGAGCVIHEAKTREIDRLGGLARSMPLTALLFSIGAVAISGLPPLNGFVSELLIYLGLFETLGIAGGGARTLEWPWAAFAIPALALIGALAVGCFVRAHAAVFLGTPRVRAHEAREGHGAHQHHEPRDPGAPMLAPMALLAAGCLLIGLAPGAVLPAIDRAVEAWAAGAPSAPPALASIVPAAWIGAIGCAIIALALAAAVWARRAARARTAGTWDCGYAAPAPRMQYTASSFAHSLVAIFRWALWPKAHQPHVNGRFPQAGHFRSHVPDAVLDRGVLPAFRVAATIFPWVRLLQQGRVQVYVLYILAILVVLLIWG